MTNSTVGPAQRRRPLIGAVDRRVLASFASVAVTAGLVRLVATGKEMIVAGRLGTSDVVDAFLLAYSVFTFLDAVLVQSSISATLPSYIRVRDRDGDDAAHHLAEAVLGRGFIGLALLVVVALFVGAPVVHLLASGFPRAKAALSGRMFVIMAPAALFSGFSTLAEAILHARRRFVAVALAPIGVPLLTAGAVLTPAVHWPYVLPVATLGGFAVEAVILAVVLARASLLVQPRISGDRAELRIVGAQYAPVVMGAVIFAGGPLVDQALAATRATGSVATLGYATRVVTTALGIPALALTNAVFPHFSTLAARHEWASLWRTFRRYSVAVFAFSIPLVLLLVCAAHPIVRLLFQRGAFHATSTARVARVQELLALQIPAYLALIMGVRALSALGRNTALIWIGAANFIINWVADWLFAIVLGLPGIALSTSVVYWISLILITRSLRREVRRREEADEVHMATMPPEPAS